MPMHSPAHPGRIVRQDCIEELGMSVNEAAEVLGVNRQTLSNLLNGRSGISAEMAFRLAAAFGSTPEMWMRLQMAYDLAETRKREREITKNVKRVQPDATSS